MDKAARELMGLDKSPNLMGIFNNNAAFSLRINHVMFEDVYPVNPNSAMAWWLDCRLGQQSLLQTKILESGWTKQVMVQFLCHLAL
jgi:hypothetical protein